MRLEMERVGWAHAPAHISGIFAPVLTSRDPRGRGSVGAGLVLDLGVHATASWRPASHASVRIRADVRDPLPISRTVAVRLLARRPGQLSLRLRHELPVEQGFGMSAAGALATAVAVAAAIGAPEEPAIEVAHLADLFGRGGLGGVAAILGGGLEVRRRAGIPPWGRVDHFPFPGAVFLLGGSRALPSPELLLDSDLLERIRRAGLPGLRRLGDRPDPRQFLREAERFTDALGLAPAWLARLIREVRATGCSAAQTMFGESVYAVPPGPAARSALVAYLVRHRLPAVEIPLARHGAIGGPGPRP